MQFASAKAVVSGGASGLGFATAKRVIEAGGHAALLDVNDEQGEKSAKELGERSTYIHTDVSNESEVQNAIKKANDFLDGITLAVNCAGVVGAARALGREAPMPSEFFEKTIAINLVGSFTVAKEAANVMQNNDPNDDGERGVIISTGERVRPHRHSRQCHRARHIHDPDGCRNDARATGIACLPDPVSATARQTGRIRRHGRLHL
jgi:NAD(P)-dependent dehydrogenase (short-subunit alcohol dehydrogenase family)